MSVLEKLQATTYPSITQTVTPRDAMLYALGIGIGDDPLDPDQLRYVYEKDLRVFPTMAITLCYPSATISTSAATNMDMRRTFHVFQGVELLKPVPLNRALVGQTRITGVYDKGEGRGILWTYENHIKDADSHEPICILKGASINTAGGGTGGPRGEAPVQRVIPNRPPDIVKTTKTLVQAALIYRLSGDYNPFHVDLEMAQAAGFERPILHGRCTFGIAGRAVLDAFSSQKELRTMEARFTSPVLPGETIRTEIWKEDDGVLFRCHVLERAKLVLDHGYVRLA